MEKNWMIRTNSFQILGPVSKKKILDLYSAGSIQDDDELCMGNGFWFYVKEKDMIDRYLLGDEIQDFNPVGDSEDSDEVSTQTDNTQIITRDNFHDQPTSHCEIDIDLQIAMPVDDFDGVLPSEEDLEYPTPEAIKQMKTSGGAKKQVRKEDILSVVNSEAILERRRRKKNIQGVQSSIDLENIESGKKKNLKVVFIIIFFFLIVFAMKYKEILSGLNSFIRSYQASAQTFSMPAEKTTQKKSPF